MYFQDTPQSCDRNIARVPYHKEGSILGCFAAESVGSGIQFLSVSWVSAWVSNAYDSLVQDNDTEHPF